MGSSLPALKYLRQASVTGVPPVLWAFSLLPPAMAGMFGRQLLCFLHLFIPRMSDLDGHIGDTGRFIELAPKTVLVLC